MTLNNVNIENSNVDILEILLKRDIEKVSSNESCNNVLSKKWKIFCLKMKGCSLENNKEHTLEL